MSAVILMHRYNVTWIIFCYGYRYRQHCNTEWRARCVYKPTPTHARAPVGSAAVNDARRAG